MAKERQLAIDAPLSEKERVLKEDAMLARDTNVKSSAMSAIPFEMTENLREKLQLFQDEKFDWLTMVRKEIWREHFYQWDRDIW